MPPADSVTTWIGQLKAGDHAAAEKLRATPRTASNEEDVALSAFASFCRGAQNGRFPRLSDRDDLWPLLVVITARKAFHVSAHENRGTRNRIPVRSGRARPASAAEVAAPGLEEIISREPTPAFAAQVAEECRRLLTSLGDADLERIAILLMEGYSQGEVAAQFGCVERTIRRRLRQIRTVWQKEIVP